MDYNYYSHSNEENINFFFSKLDKGEDIVSKYNLDNNKISHMLNNIINDLDLLKDKTENFEKLLKFKNIIVKNTSLDKSQINKIDRLIKEIQIKVRVKIHHKDVQRQREGIDKRLNGLKIIYKLRVQEVFHQRFSDACKLRSINISERDQIEKSVKKEIDKELEKNQVFLKELKMLAKTAADKGDFIEANEFITEIETAISSLGSGNDLLNLYKQKVEENAPSTERSGSDDTNIQRIKNPPENVENLLKKRVAAEKWRKNEIKGKSESAKKIKEINETFQVKNWAVETLNKFVILYNTSFEELNTHLNELHKIDGELNSLSSDLKYYKKEIEKLNKSIDKIKNDLDNENNEINNNDRKLKSLISKRDEYQQDIENLVNQAELLRKNLKIITKKLKEEIEIFNNSVDEYSSNTEINFNLLKSNIQKYDNSVKIHLPHALEFGIYKLSLDESGDFPVVKFPDVSTLKALSITNNDLFPELSETVGKHGTGRHGWQTGMELQARRLATKGVTPDQPGHEWGYSRKVEGNNDAIRAESRVGEASEASLFLNPEVEMEAVQRALTLVNEQCVWAEVEHQGEWQPIKRVSVIVGPPKGSDSIGYGFGIRPSESGSNKKALPAVNKAINEFREGKINQEKLFERLGVEYSRRRGSGVSSESDPEEVQILTHCLVALKRVEGKWVNVTQYPTPITDAGWSLAGKEVRMSRNSPPLTSPNLQA